MTCSNASTPSSALHGESLLENDGSRGRTRVVAHVVMMYPARLSCFTTNRWLILLSLRRKPKRSIDQPPLSSHSHTERPEPYSLNNQDILRHLSRRLTDLLGLRSDRHLSQRFHQSRSGRSVQVRSNALTGLDEECERRA
jgi:hypothetical protein